MKVKKLMPELYSDSDINTMVKNLYSDCRDIECDECPHKGQIDGESCKCDVIMELWRKWKNAKYGGLEEDILP